MVKFLTTTGVSYQLEEIIKGAKQQLVIISPFLRVNDRIKELLEDRDRLKIDVRVIYGKNDLKPEENNWLGSMNSIRTSFCKNLHAKCYLNENHALVTSMNLYEFSQVNNNEMGLLISRSEEPNLYDEIHEESMRLVRTSEEIRVTVARIETAEEEDDESGAQSTQRKTQPIPEELALGFCIRCKTDIAPDPTKPYCLSHYRSWNRYKNEEYEEKYCHLCGRECPATMAMPICSDCYDKYVA